MLLNRRLAPDPRIRSCVQFIAAYLLITNSKFALGLLVLIGEGLKLLDWLRLQDLDAEFDVTLGVLVTGL